MRAEDPITEELRNRTMEEEHTERERVWEYEHRHDDREIELGEFVPERVRARWREQEKVR